MMTAAAALSVLPQSHAFELNDLVRRKLDCPGTQLSPAESRSCLVSCIRHGKAAARLAEEGTMPTAADIEATLCLVHLLHLWFPSSQRLH